MRSPIFAYLVNPQVLIRNSHSVRGNHLVSAPSPKDEIGRPDHAKPRPEVIPVWSLVHVERGERHENRKGDDLL